MAIVQQKLSNELPLYAMLKNPGFKIKRDYKVFLIILIPSFILLALFPNIYLFYEINYSNFFSSEYGWYTYIRGETSTVNHIFGLFYSLLLSILFSFIATLIVRKKITDGSKLKILMCSLYLAILLGLVYLIYFLLNVSGSNSYGFMYALEAVRSQVLLLITLYFLIAFPSVILIVKKRTKLIIE